MDAIAAGRPANAGGLTTGSLRVTMSPNVPAAMVAPRSPWTD
ncbi:MAG TPA: hypothetical protein VFD64_02605 [Gemmatimonadaceae bacterium]|nr:hypothetical protein [Gemmatimonadaceae bacterium]